MEIPGSTLPLSHSPHIKIDFTFDKRVFFPSSRQVPRLSYYYPCCFSPSTSSSDLKKKNQKGACPSRQFHSTVAWLNLVVCMRWLLRSSSQFFLLCFVLKQIPYAWGSTVSTQKWPHLAWFQLQTLRRHTLVWRAWGMARDGKNLHSLVLTVSIPLLQLPTASALHVHNGYHLLNAYYTPGVTLNISHGWSESIFTTSLQVSYYYIHLRSADEKPEAQRG